MHNKQDWEARIFDTIVSEIVALATGKRNNCILATRIAIEILNRFNIRAWAQPVDMFILNPAATREYNGGHPFPLKPPGCIGVGTNPNEPITDGTGYNAHLVAVTKYAFLDLTLDQYSVSDIDVCVEPLWCRDRSLRSGLRVETELNGCLVVWTPREDRSYKQLPAWGLGDSPAARLLVDVAFRKILDTMP